ncbi:MAG: carbohydrate ABC transporter permease [Chloroflexota bacterium]|nr:carbohydrate ABC transporter permease [Chloroflexota bacterium]
MQRTVDIQLLRSRIERVSLRAFLYIVVAVGGVMFAIPFVWMVRTSVMPMWQIYVFPPQWIPAELVFDNFRIPGLPFERWFLNSTVIVLLNIVRAVTASSIVAFAFARVRFPGREALFLVVLATMMLPSQVTTIPTYLLFSRLGWLDTYLPLFLRASIADPFHVFLLRQFFRTLPRELDDAARIDGCGLFGIFWRIALPQSLPALGVVSIFEFTYNWNNFYLPLIYLNSVNKFPVALGLRLMQGQYRTNMGSMMAAALMAVAPILVIFFLAQRYFVQGIVITGIKG